MTLALRCSADSRVDCPLPLQRWKEAFLARGEYGDAIVPKVVLGATHVRRSSHASIALRRCAPT